MAFDTRHSVASPPADDADYRDTFAPARGERLVVIVATTLAIVIVATIAVLMGMA
jgi:hypothetical protein